MRSKSTSTALLAAFMSVVFIGSAFGQIEAGPKVTMSKPYVTAEMITLPVEGDFEAFKLTVKGPDNYFFENMFSGENVPFVDAFGPYGETLKDGAYSFRLEMMPKLSDDALDALRFARETGDMTEVNEMRKAGLIPEATEPVYGYFSIAEGLIVPPDQIETSFAAKNEGRDPGEKPGNPGENSNDDFIGDVGENDSDGGVRDQIIGDDLIVTRSLCVGFDCVNGEVFGFDTIKLKENNLRIKFEDTSVGSFPSTDWQLTANSNASGGANKFSVDDITASRTPFTIEGNAPSHSLYVDNGGRIGIRTNQPVVDLHVVDGDTPTLRLEQDTSSGFAAQTWDVAGNETSFFVRDASNGSTLPFRIRPSAPSNALVIDEDGDVGIGTLAADAELDVDGGTGDATALVQSSGGVPQFLAQHTGTAVSARREMFVLENHGEPAFRFSNTDPAAADDWSMILLASDQFLISRNGSGANEMMISSGGDVTIGGGLTELSDVNMKENFEQVDPVEVLDRVVDLPISTWNYIRDEDQIRHMGPMAQDFAAAFGLGKTTTGITSIDINGVMMAAIQGLNQRIQDKEAALAEKDETITSLEKRLADLERMVQSLADEKQ